MSLSRLFELLDKETLDANEIKELKRNVKEAKLSGEQLGKKDSEMLEQEVKAYQFKKRLNNDQMILKIIGWNDKITGHLASSGKFLHKGQTLFNFKRHLEGIWNKLKRDQQEMLGTRSGRSVADIAASLFAEEAKAPPLPFCDLLDNLEFDDIPKISDVREVIKKERAGNNLKEFLMKEIDDYRKKHHLSQSDMEGHIDLWIDKFSNPSHFKTLVGKDDLVANLKEINNEFRVTAALAEVALLAQRAAIAMTTAHPKLQKVIVDLTLPDTMQLFESMQQVAKNKKFPAMQAQLQGWLANYGNPVDQKKLEQAVLRYQTANNLSHQEMVRRLDGWMHHVVGGTESSVFQKGFDPGQLEALRNLREGLIVAKEKIKKFDVDVAFAPSISQEEINRFLNGQMKSWSGDPHDLLTSVLEFEAEHLIPYGMMAKHIGEWREKLEKKLTEAELDSKETEAHQFLDEQKKKWDQNPKSLLKSILEFEAKTLTSRQEMLRHIDEWMRVEKTSQRRSGDHSGTEFLSTLGFIHKELSKTPLSRQIPSTGLHFSDALQGVYQDLGKRNPADNPIWVLRGTPAFLEELDAFDWSAEQNQKIKYGIENTNRKYDVVRLYGSLEAYQAAHQLTNEEMLKKIDHWQKLIKHSDPTNPAGKELNEKLNKIVAQIRKLPKDDRLENPTAIIVRRIDVCHRYKSAIEAEMEKYQQKHPRLDSGTLCKKFPEYRVMKDNYDAISVVEKALKQTKKDPALILEDANTVLYKYRAKLEKPISSKVKGLWSMFLEAFGAIGRAVKMGKGFLAEVKLVVPTKLAAVKKVAAKAKVDVRSFTADRKREPKPVAKESVAQPVDVDARSEPVDDVKEKIDQRIRHAQAFKANAEHLVWGAISREILSKVTGLAADPDGMSKVIAFIDNQKDNILLAIREDKPLHLTIPGFEMVTPVSGAHSEVKFKAVNHQIKVHELVGQMMKEDKRFQADVSGCRVVNQLLKRTSKETGKWVVAGENPAATVKRLDAWEPRLVDVAKLDPRLETDAMREKRVAAEKKEAKLPEGFGTTKPKSKPHPVKTKEGLFGRSGKKPTDGTAVVARKKSR